MNLGDSWSKHGLSASHLNPATPLLPPCSTAPPFADATSSVARSRIDAASIAPDRWHLLQVGTGQEQLTHQLHVQRTPRPVPVATVTELRRQRSSRRAVPGGKRAWPGRKTNMTCVDKQVENGHAKQHVAFLSSIFFRMHPQRLTWTLNMDL